MDLWQLAEADVGDELGGEEGEGSTVLVVGDKSAGKSSLIQSFLKPNSSKDPKATFALDYNFVRRKNAGGSSSSGSSSSGSGPGGAASTGGGSGGGGSNVAHLWELGGDIYEPKLLEIPLSVKALAVSSVIIVCDLSKPNNILSSLKRWISLVRDVILARLTAMQEARNPKAAELKQGCTEAYGLTHPDIARVRPCEVPLYIVGNKYDALKSVPLADRRTLLQVMRFISHYHGATLLLSSSFERESFRSLMNSACFGLPLKPSFEVGVDRANFVSVGRDDFVAILLGTVPGEEAAAGKSRLAYTEADTATYISGHGITRESWGKFADLLTQTFGAADPGPSASAVSEERKETDGADAAVEYPEVEVDEIRSQKDAALQRYVIEAARREAMALKSSNPSSRDQPEDEGAESVDARRRRK